MTILNKENPFNFAVLNEELLKEVPEEIKVHLHYIFIHNPVDNTFEIRKDSSGTLKHRSPLKNEDELYDLIYEIYYSFDKIDPKKTDDA